MYEINRKMTWSGVKAGIVITLAFTALFITVFFTGAINTYLNPKTIIYISIENTQGLRVSAPVWLYGIESGNVKAISMYPHGAIITIALNNSVLKYLRKDASAKISTIGIMGDKYLEITPGLSTAQWSRSDTLRGFNTREFEDILSTSTSTMAQLDSTARNLTMLIGAVRNDKGTLGKLINDSTLYDNFSTALGSLSISLNQFHKSNGSFARLLQDTSLYYNISNASVELTYLIKNIDSLINTIEDGFDNGSVAGSLLRNNDLTDSLRQTISSYRNTAQSLSALINEIKLNPKKFFNFQIF